MKLIQSVHRDFFKVQIVSTVVNKIHLDISLKGRGKHTARFQINVQNYMPLLIKINTINAFLH
jgi:hypothetical protein